MQNHWLLHDYWTSYGQVKRDEAHKVVIVKYCPLLSTENPYWREQKDLRAASEYHGSGAARSSRDRELDHGHSSNYPSLGNCVRRNECCSGTLSFCKLTSSLTIPFRNANWSRRCNSTSHGTRHLETFRCVGSNTAIWRSDNNGKLWRLVTTFTYFGQLSLDLAFHMFFMCVVVELPDMV